MNETPHSSIAGRAIIPFLSFCVLWVLLAHAFIPRIWDAQPYGLDGRLLADGVFLLAATGLVYGLVRRAARAAQNTLNESIQRNERARIALEAAGAGIWEVNAPSPTESYSGEIFSTLGIQPVASNDIFLAFRERIHPEDQAKLREANAAVQKGGHDQFRLKCRIRDSKDRWRHIAIRGRCVGSTHDNMPARITGILSDVTEEAEREIELVTARNMFNALLDTIPFPVAMVDSRGALKLSSQSWRRAAADEKYNVRLPVWEHNSTEWSRDTSEDFREALQTVLSGQQREVTLPLAKDEAGTPTGPETVLRAYRQGTEIAGAVIAVRETTDDQETIARLRTEMGHLRDENDRRQAKIENLQREVEELAAKIEEIQPLNAELKGHVAVLEQQVEDLKQRKKNSRMGPKPYRLNYENWNCEMMNSACRTTNSVLASTVFPPKTKNSNIETTTSSRNCRRFNMK